MHKMSGVLSSSRNNFTKLINYFTGSTPHYSELEITKINILWLTTVATSFQIDYLENLFSFLTTVKESVSSTQISFFFSTSFLFPSFSFGNISFFSDGGAMVPSNKEIIQVDPNIYLSFTKGR